MKQRVHVVTAIAAGILLLILAACGQKAADKWQEQYDLGIRYLEEGNYEEAVLAFNVAIEIDPKRADAYIGLADAYIAVEDYDSAKAALERALGQVDDVKAIQKKLDSLLEFIRNAAPSEDFQPDNGEENMLDSDTQQKPDQPGLSDQVPDLEAGNGAGADEIEDSADTQENIDTGEPVQDVPAEQPSQSPQSGKEYRYAVDAVGSATIWDLHQSLMNSGRYVFEGFGITEGEWALYATYHTTGFESYHEVGSASQDAVEDLNQDGTFSEDEVISQLSGNIVHGISGTYNPVSMEISPVFRDAMTYSEIIQACDDNGYEYEQHEEPSYAEIFLRVTQRNGQHITFAWDSALNVEDITDRAPIRYSVW